MKFCIQSIEFGARSDDKLPNHRFLCDGRMWYKLVSHAEGVQKRRHSEVACEAVLSHVDELQKEVVESRGLVLNELGGVLHLKHL